MKSVDAESLWVSERRRGCFGLRVYNSEWRTGDDGAGDQLPERQTRTVAIGVV